MVYRNGRFYFFGIFFFLIYSWQTCKCIKWKRYLSLAAGAKSHENFQTAEKRKLDFVHFYFILYV